MESLEDIKKIIENMSPEMTKRHHVAIGSILKRNPLNKLNETKGMTLVNLSMIPNETIHEIRQYLLYVMDQENTLSQIETNALEYKEYFFSEKEDKHNSDVLDNLVEE
jgi:hypothetical protein